jgi:hypothetical protein
MRIAIHGYARVGKDEVGKILMDHYGLQRRAFGDLIKSDLDELVNAHLGFSAFTEIDSEKKQIRKILVDWGYANYESIEKRYFANLPKYVVNTRIFRPRECKLWKEHGGIVLHVIRPGYGPAEPSEEHELKACIEQGLVDDVIMNDGDLDRLRYVTMEVMKRHYPTEDV